MVPTCFSGLEQDRKDAAKAYEDITVRDQKSILMTVLVTVFADDLDELTKFTKLVQNRVEKHLCKISVRTSDQENGFNSCLPIGCNKARLNRLMNTESAALLSRLSLWSSHSHTEPSME